MHNYLLTWVNQYLTSMTLDQFTTTPALLILIRGPWPTTLAHVTRATRRSRKSISWSMTMTRAHSDEGYDDYAEVDKILDRNYLLRVEGQCVVHSYLEEQRVHAGHLAVHAAALGLEVIYQAVPDGQDPDTMTVRHRWSFRRVTLDEIYSYVGSRPGIKFTDLVEAIFGRDIRTEAARREAKKKLRVALFHLRHAGRIEKRFNAEGVECWQPARARTGLALTSVSADLPAVDVSSPRDRTVDELEAGASILRGLKVYDRAALDRDPNLYHDLVREVIRRADAARPSP